MLKFENDYLMSQLTTLQIGGPAKKFVAVKTQEELLEAIQYAKSQGMKYLVIGGGSNLLVSDKGVNCLVIKNEVSGIFTSKESEPTFEVEATEVTVKSGTPLQQLVDYTILHGLSGLQKLAGIPGTVGGAVYGNAGAYGQSISDHLTNIVILGSTKHNRKMTLRKNGCHFSYRHSIFKKTQDIILEVTFQLEPGDPETLKKEAEEVLSKRLIKYPPGIKCPGSFFKNLIASEIPPEILKSLPAEKIVYGKLPAGALLEMVGAKGQKLDGIEIASYHANLFINKRGGTAKAFCDLARTYALKVKEKFNITLEPEVQLINLPPLI